MLFRSMIVNLKFKEKRFLFKNVDSDYIIKNFNSVNELIKNNNSLYSHIINGDPGLLSSLKYYSEEYILNTLSSLNTFSDFKEMSKIYKLSYINNEHKDLINNFFKNKNYNKYFILDINIDEITNICLKYHNIKSFKKDYPTIYKYLLKNKLVSVCFNHIKTLKFRNNL